jgi:uncharacterized protein YkwD
VLAGAVLAGGASIASRMSAAPTPNPVSDIAVIQVATPTTAATSAFTQAASTSKAQPTTTTPPATTTTTTTTTPPPPPVVTTTTTSTPPASQTQQVFALVNQARTQAGCKALADDPRLDTAAQQHSDDMADRDYFSHTTPEGVTFDKRETAAGYPSPGGENIAAGQSSAQQVMTAWMNSSGHRANILNCSFVAIGIGLNTHGWYWTQDFGR